MKRILTAASVLILLLVFSVAALLALPAGEAGADNNECIWGEPVVNPKGPCDRPGPPPEPDDCLPGPDGCGEPTFLPVLKCDMCGNMLAFCFASVWWGGAFGSWMLVLGVMGGLAWPLWRHRKRGHLPVDRPRQRLEIAAKERARRFDEAGED